VSASTLAVYPAIDLLGGRAVRLVKGHADTATVVGEPHALAARFAAAPLLHVVDLDGAFAGGPRQTALVAALAKEHRVQAGGGVRTLADIDTLLSAGVVRVVVGTAVLADPAFLDEVARRFDPAQIVIAADVKDGFVAGAGWMTTSSVRPEDLADRLIERGLLHVLCTAVHKDGTLEGPDLDVLARVRRGPLQVIASGGIGSLDDVRAVRGCAGVVIGKALYAERFTLQQALAVAAGKEP
jgi:phosphoribosylformimino-5-aminoimidazole carboxamide ribotide isomerase